LLLNGGRRGIGQGDQPQPGVTHQLKSISHVGVCRKRQHALENPTTVGGRERDTTRRRRHVERCTTNAGEV